MFKPTKTAKGFNPLEPFAVLCDPAWTQTRDLLLRRPMAVLVHS